MSTEVAVRQGPSAEVAAAIEAAPAAVRGALHDLRSLILEAAAARPEVGDLVETLKWSEPAYLPKKPRIGTTVRMNALKGSDTEVALYFHCQTTLVEEFRALYPERCAFEGNRALIMAVDKPLPADAIRHCVQRALTYHLAKRAA